MNKTQREMLLDIAEHENTTPGEIAERLFLCRNSIYKQMKGIRRYLVKTPAPRSGLPNRWRIRPGTVDWCPHCGQVIR